MTDRRKFLGTLGTLGAVTAAGLSLDVGELHAANALARTGAWDISWLDKLRAAKYRVAFNASEAVDSEVFVQADRFLVGMRDAESVPESDCRVVMVFRHEGTAMGFNDAMWDKYKIGEYSKVNDPNTKAPARRNIYWSSGSSATPEPSALETLMARGSISLVCNVATNRYARDFARQTGATTDAVFADIKANLVPGAILVPSGIYGLIRAQNAGCAYMPGA